MSKIDLENVDYLPSVAQSAIVGNSKVFKDYAYGAIPHIKKAIQQHGALYAAYHHYDRYSDNEGPFFNKQYNYDPEFRKLFKIKASFDTDMSRTAAAERSLGHCVGDILRRENLKPFDAEALSEVVEWASRDAEDQNLLSVGLGRLRELLMESHTWAAGGKAALVGRVHVRKAIEHKRYRSSLYQEKLIRAFEDGVIQVDTDRAEVGQINGLAVVDLTDYRFGHPSRITANVFMGQEGVVNIEREVRMTGPIHNKGLTH